MLLFKRSSFKRIIALSILGLILWAVFTPQGNTRSTAVLRTITEQIQIPYSGNENATFVTLSKNDELKNLLPTIKNVEERFNNRFHYGWIFLNDEEFSEEFKEKVTAEVSGPVQFGRIPKEHWGYPDFIDQEKAKYEREQMANDGVIYADSESYRHMCRFESGFFWRHPLLDKYKYYWRVEPSTRLLCDVITDPFKYMRVNGKKYGFTISIYEFYRTIPTLWDTTKEFIKEHPEYVHKHNAIDFISEDGGNSYNLCHFWSNFEIADLDFWRSKPYREYFDYLDKSGGFFYERWGDAPVHSIAASLFLDRDEIHWFDTIGYFHGPYQNCPEDELARKELNCACPAGPDIPQGFDINFAFQGYSCTGRWARMIGYPIPEYAANN
ncbi:hypothetical protein DASB73_021950 [Starmerella bacillaris]|uniref:Uncharacterized protein n=1 Tax=Starmerella bacillaris TaxID=1247836 RepID=A0AAV5RJJ1_STABA|nr:hypothetical protein DASB73_021950 [Starmerella bacillaris]